MISLTILLASLGCAMASDLVPVYEWKYFDYRWNNESDKELAISTGLYNYTNVILYDAELHNDRRVFVTTPRTHDANPASLSTVSTEQDANGQALLQPYPSPEWHVVGNCSGITNALRIVVDECDNMWTVDSGTIGDDVICPAQILKFDLKTDQLVTRYKIPKEVSKGGLLSTNVVITEGAKCEKLMLIAADLRGSGFMIFDGSTSWRLDSDNFKPDANLSSLPVGDQTVNITYGPIGILVLDKKFADIDMALMWSFSGNHAYGLPIQDLLNSRDSQENLRWYKSEYELPIPATAGIISKQGIGFGAYVGHQKLICDWLGDPVTSENMDVLLEESDLSPAITSMKILTDDHGEEYLIFVMNDYLRLRAGIADFREVTSGIYLAKIADLTKGTRCQQKADFIPAKSWTERGYIPLKDHDDFNI